MRLLRSSFCCLTLFWLCLPATAATDVTVLSLDEAAANAEFSAPARVLSRNDSTLSAEISAAVQSVSAEVGDQVDAGKLLIKLDPTDYQLALDQAKANITATRARIKQAQLRLQRAQALGDKQYVSADELLARETDVSVLQADLVALQVQRKVAERNLSKTEITAPFAGAVRQRLVSLGDLVLPGTPLLNLVEVSAYEVEAQLQPDQAASLRQVSQASLVRGRQSWPLEPARILPLIDSSSLTQTARLVFTDQAAPVGLSGKLVWRDTAAYLAPQWVLRRGDHLGVFILRGTQAEFVVLPEAQEGRSVRVMLEPTTQLIRTGRHSLQHGDEVRVIQQ